VKVLANVTDTFRVMLFPDTLTALEFAFSVHCEFDTVPLPPGVNAGANQAVPASLRRFN
jgi:hypothetical protein